MNTPTLKTIDAAIGAAQTKRTELAALIATHRRARIAIETDINAASQALANAAAPLTDALVAAALGTGDVAVTTAARAERDRAARALAAARQREQEADDQGAIERALSARVAVVDADAADLRQQRTEAVDAGLIAELQDHAASYTAAASQAMQALAHALALDGALTARGKPQDVRTSSLAETALGSFAGHALPSWDDLVQQARAQVFARVNA